MLNIVHEDESLLVVNKPAGLVCHPSKGDAMSSLIGRARAYLGEGTAVHMVNRIDRETSGLVMVAKSREVAGELGRLFERRAVRKGYVAIVHGMMESAEGVIRSALGKDEASTVAIKDKVRDDGAPSETRYKVLSTWTASKEALSEVHAAILSIAVGLGEEAVLGFERECWTRAAEGAAFSLLSLDPKSGRKHQIRIHLASVGFPIVGDKLYGADEQIYLDFVMGRMKQEDWRRLILPYHALHAGELSFEWRGREWAFQVPAESWFTGFIS